MGSNPSAAVGGAKRFHRDLRRDLRRPFSFLQPEPRINPLASSADWSCGHVYFDVVQRFQVQHVHHWPAAAVTGRKRGTKVANPYGFESANKLQSLLDTRQDVPSATRATVSARPSARRPAPLRRWFRRGSRIRRQCRTGSSRKKTRVYRELNYPDCLNLASRWKTLRILLADRKRKNRSSKLRRRQHRGLRRHPSSGRKAGGRLTTCCRN